MLKEGAEEHAPHPQAVDHYIRGVIYDQQGEITRAITEYRRALRFDSTSASIYLALAEDYLALRLFDDAVTQLHLGYGADPHSTGILLYLSDLLLDMNQPDSAAFFAEKLVEIDPDNKKYRYSFANILKYLRRHDESIEQYQAILDKNPEEREALGQLSTLYIALSDFQSALETSRKLYALYPGDDRICFTLASLLAELDEHAEADSFFAQTTEINPDDPRYFTNWAYMHLRIRDFNRAVEILENSTYHHPTTAEVWALLGSAHQSAGQDSLALEALDVSLELDAAQVGPYVTLGIIYEERGDLDRAIEVYEQALIIEPDDALLLNNFAYLLAEKDLRLQEALEYSQKALEADPENSSYLDTIGWIYYRLEDFTEAKDYIQHAHELDAENPVILEHLGDIYNAMGEKRLARKTWRKALEFDPDNIAIREKLAR
ncbi:hypothetical protein CEE37_11025 [candidate division LCP-89 bacterium B3_LCP]|uniref:Uncharacterized protein n=1 Tax=candidate division LCP-89 bacterium B3_LCP TaxID=2012998 RepID=A0A532UXZ0_UNCL8|nr:MAG: hypothetical protein CEE37_11025 [candidate division LCP-89 bacterium B3_LCP]